MFGGKFCHYYQKIQEDLHYLLICYLALIPITLLLGFVAADMDNLLYQMEDTVFRSSMDRAAGDAVSTLLETSGDPTDWEVNGNTQDSGTCSV